MMEPPVETAELRAHYETIFADVSGIIDTARRTAVRLVNTVMTATYWLKGQSHYVDQRSKGTERTIAKLRLTSRFPSWVRKLLPASRKLARYSHFLIGWRPAGGCAGEVITRSNAYLEKSLRMLVVHYGY